MGWLETRIGFLYIRAAIRLRPKGNESMTKPIFPDSFVWGCATAAYQVEGAANEDGRGPSIWDTFCKTPGRVACGHTGDVAVDQYHRYPEDIRLMQWLGVKAYRLSISWSRVLPSGEGQINEKGMAYYERLIDALLAAGIVPYITLFHWDLPQGLQDKYNGWESRETSQRFAEYAAIVVQRLSDRVTNWMTINEFWCFTARGHEVGDFAPGKKLPRKAGNRIAHHALLAHGLGVRAIRASAKRKPNVGLADNFAISVPIIETPEHVAAAGKAMRVENARFMTAVMEGAYLESYLQREGANAPEFTTEDLRIISEPLDFVGMNCYLPQYVRAAASAGGYEVVPLAPGHPRMSTEWLYLGPECLYWGVRHLAKVWNVKSIYITENGCAAKDRLTVGTTTGKAEVLDTDRIMYLRGHLKSAERAIQERLPLHGYFLWSLLDNFEWAEGYTQRFGLVYVNYDDLSRTPKCSAEFYRETIKARKVL